MRNKYIKFLDHHGIGAQEGSVLRELVRGDEICVKKPCGRLRAISQSDLRK